MAGHSSGRLAAAALTFVLGGCAFVDEALLPMATGEFAPPQPPAQIASTATANPAATQPLITIRFEDPAAEFRPLLRQTLDEALARRPAAVFWVVALVPAAGDPEDNAARARAHLDEVLDAMAAAGLTDERVSATLLTTERAAVDEVQIFVR